MVSLKPAEQETGLSGLESIAGQHDFVTLISAKALEGSVRLPSFAVLCPDGVVELSVDAAGVTVGPHSFLVTNPGQTITAEAGAKTDIRIVTIGLTTALVAESYEELRVASRRLFRSNQRLRHGSIAFHNAARAHDSCVSPVLRRIQSACRLGVHDRRWLEGQLRILAERILFAEHRRDPPGAPRTQRRGALASRLTRVRDYIDNSYHRPLRLEQLAQVVYASPYHFLRMFKSTYGQTPHQYLIRRRLEASRDLLETTNLPIKEISERVGFQNANGFYKAFKRCYDCSPASFRQANGLVLRSPRM